MSERPITCGERLMLMGFIVAPLFCMIAALSLHGTSSSEWVTLRLFVAMTVVLCGLLCTARAEGLSGCLPVLRKVFAAGITCWAVLAFVFPDSVYLMTVYLSGIFWLMTFVCLIYDMF